MKEFPTPQKYHSVYSSLFIGKSLIRNKRPFRQAWTSYFSRVNFTICSNISFLIDLMPCLQIKSSYTRLLLFLGNGEDYLNKKLRSHDKILFTTWATPRLYYRRQAMLWKNAGTSVCNNRLRIQGTWWRGLCLHGQTYQCAYVWCMT